MNFWTRFRLWWRKKFNQPPVRGETPVQIAQMLNCPLWGATTPDTCDSCPFFGGRYYPDNEKILLHSIGMVKCRFDGRETEPEKRLLGRYAAEGLDVEIVRCVSCHSPYIDVLGAEAPVCQRTLCQSRMQVTNPLISAMRRGTLSPTRGRLRRLRGRREVIGDALGGMEEDDLDVEESRFRPRIPPTAPGQEAGEGTRQESGG
ncbi:MAG TPA: hypothetical protein VJM10_02970 [Candidatus Methylomirabilis sp.]|nr:hypothetical protein [Candidatus Methylomirabilis sp.]